MKWLVALALINISACSFDKSIKTHNIKNLPNSVTVTAVGKDLEQAKGIALQQAIDTVVGTVLVTEKELFNNELKRYEILQHSAGYIDDYKIIGTRQLKEGVEVTLDVKVQSSRIANRILGPTESIATVAGERMSSQYKTYLKDRKSGDELIKLVLQSYSTKAFTVRETGSAWGLYSNRDAVFTVWFELKYNYDFLNSLDEVLSITQDGKNSDIRQSIIYVQKKDPKAWIFGQTNVYYFNDRKRVRIIEQEVGVPISVMGKLYDDQGKSIATACGRDDRGFSYLPFGLFDPNYESTSPIAFRGNEAYHGVLNFVFSADDNKLQSLNKASKVSLFYRIGNC